MLSRFRLAQISDTHLSRTHAYFDDNWRVLLDELSADLPDLVIHTGDVSFNGPVSDDDVAHGRAELDRLPCRWHALAGNHDVGEAPAHSRLAQPLNDERIARWRRSFGELWWLEDIGEWRLIGLDTALMGSERSEEAAQTAFLAAALAGRDGRETMVFLHMPPFETRPDDERPTTSAIPFRVRGKLLDTCADAGVRVIACGHLHVYNVTQYREIEIVWAPTTAMVPIEKRRSFGGGIPRPGYLVWDFDGKALSHRLVEPELMIAMDVTAWTNRNGGTTTTMPPRPLPLRPLLTP
jgi:3',5'-cyclic AMP phosphodiesterase CpdA